MRLQASQREKEHEKKKIFFFKAAPLNAKTKKKKKKITYSSWPMGITFHLGEDEVSRFEIASHVS